MSTKYYIGSGSDWNTDANWSTTSGGSADTTFPTGADDAIFDAASGSCTLDAAVACLSLAIGRSGSLYAGTLAFSTHAIAIGTGGLDCTYGSSATLDMGSSSGHTCAGNWDVSAIGTYVLGTSTVDYTGVANVNIPSPRIPYATIISGTITDVGTDFYAYASLTITGQLNTSYLYQIAGTATLSGTLNCSGANVQLSRPTNITGGTITGSGTCRISAELTGAFSAINVANFKFWNSQTLPSGTIDSALVQVDGITDGDTFTVGGDTVFTGNVIINNTHATNSMTWSNVNNYDLTFQKNVTLATTGGPLTWTKGTGTITLSGGNAQNINFLGKAVEDIVVNKTAGALVMTGAVTTDSFTGTSTGSGTFDPNGQTITVTGACDWAAAFRFDSSQLTMDACRWIVGGNFTADGQYLHATEPWYLQVTGSAQCSGEGEVEYSKATGFRTVEAPSWTDLADNDNWVFGEETSSSTLALLTTSTVALSTSSTFALPTSSTVGQSTSSTVVMSTLSTTSTSLTESTSSQSTQSLSTSSTLLAASTSTASTISTPSTQSESSSSTPSTISTVSTLSTQSASSISTSSTQSLSTLSTLSTPSTPSTLSTTSQSTSISQSTQSTSSTPSTLSTSSSFSTASSLSTSSTAAMSTSSSSLSTSSTSCSGTDQATGRRTLTATISCNISSTITNRLDDGTLVQAKVNRTMGSFSFATGIADNQATRAWQQKSETILSGTTKDIDLYDFADEDIGGGLGRDHLGQLLILKQSVAFMLKHISGAGRLEMMPTQPANYATWVPSLTVSAGSALRAGGAVALVQPKSAAMAVADGSSHILRLGANGGDVVYSLYLLGRHHGVGV